RPALPVRHKALKVRPEPRCRPWLVGPCRRARHRRNRRRSPATRHRRRARSPKALSAPRRRERRRPVIRYLPRAGLLSTAGLLSLRSLLRPLRLLRALLASAVVVRSGEADFPRRPAARCLGLYIIPRGGI